MSVFAFPDRNDLWRQMRSGSARHWDVIVIGGGITGAGILREAVRRGYRCLLLEQRDFCWGTSSRSSKLVHGGLRYLAAGKLGLTRHALQERERLLAEAPFLVRRLSFYYPLYRGVFPPRAAAGILFWLYDRLAGIDDHRRVDTQRLGERFPALDTASITAAYRYTDAVTDDARLVLRILHEAVQSGGSVRNYSRVVSLLRTGTGGGRGPVNGVRVEDTGSGEHLDLEAAVVINATGPWADRFGSEPPDGLRIHPQRGSHLVLPADEFPAPAALFLRNPDDGRRLFVYPWEGRTIVGTTDIAHEPGLDSPASITPAELRYLLRAVRPLFGARRPGPEDVISTWSGVRPIIAAGAVGRPSRASREHRVWSEPGLVSCSGGKLTTFHHMAMDVMKHAAGDLPPPRGPGQPDQRIFREHSVGPEALRGLDPGCAVTLIGRFGAAALELVQTAEPGELRMLGASGVCRAELRWSLQNEAVVHLDDLLLRRSRFGLLLPAGGEDWLHEVHPICESAGGWDGRRWTFECERYRDIIGQYYSVPGVESGACPRSSGRDRPPCA